MKSRSRDMKLLKYFLFHLPKKKTFTFFFVRVLIYTGVYIIVSIIFKRPAFPSISLIFTSTFESVLPGFFKHFPPTLLRWFIVFIVGSISGVALGIPTGYFRSFHKIVRFDIDFFRSIPATIFITFVLAAFGDGHLQRSIPALYITFFTVLFYVSKQASILDRKRIEHLRELGAKSPFILQNCVLLELMPSIMVAVRQAISLSFLVAISIELIVGSYNNWGLGRLIYDWQFNQDYSSIIMALFLIGFFGYALNLSMILINKICIPWMKKETLV